MGDPNGFSLTEKDMKFTMQESQQTTDENVTAIDARSVNPFETMPPELFEKLKGSILSCQNQDVFYKTYKKLLTDIENGDLSSSYDETLAKSAKPEVECTGIDENEEDFYKRFIANSFQDDILHSALIEKVHLNFDQVAIHLPKNNPFNIADGRYYMPLELFSLYWSELSDVQRHYFSDCIYRGESVANWREAGASEGNYFTSPVVVTNQDFDKSNLSLIDKKDPDEAGLEYLTTLPEHARRNLYIAGSISHEIAHNIYGNIVQGRDTESEWKQIVDEAGGSITTYAKNYEEHTGSRDYDENFAEAVRIYTTVSGYFDSESLLPIKQFLKQNFPQIVEKAPLVDAAATQRAEVRKSLEKGGNISAGEPYNAPEFKSTKKITIGPDGTIYRSSDADTDQQKIEDIRENITGL